MGFTFKGKQVSNINFNGTSLNTLKFRGVTVWEKYTPPTIEYLWILPLSNTSINMNSETGLAKTMLNMEYSLDKTTWTKFSSIKTAVSIPANTKVYLRNTESWQCSQLTKVVSTLQSVDYNIGGDIEAIQDYQNITTQITVSNKYKSMFQGDTHIINAGELLLNYTTLLSYCYYQMFFNCKNLTAAPELPAPTLVTYCYHLMFYNCAKLNKVIVRATSWNKSYTANWLGSVASTGTIYNLGGASIPTSDQSGCPNGWTIVRSLP